MYWFSDFCKNIQDTQISMQIRTKYEYLIDPDFKNFFFLQLSYARGVTLEVVMHVRCICRSSVHRQTGGRTTALHTVCHQQQPQQWQSGKQPSLTPSATSSALSHQSINKRKNSSPLMKKKGDACRTQHVLMLNLFVRDVIRPL